MRIILLSIVISLTTGCSGLAETIRKNQQKQQVYKQYASKYYASCQKEAFNYYPVNMVEKERPKSLYKPQKTVTCTTFGNTTNCRDTTADFSGMIEQAENNANRLAGNSNTYDVNARLRESHIKNCIDNNLRGDSSYSADVRRVDYNGGSDRAKPKPLKVYTQHQVKPSGNESRLVKYRLNGYDEFQNGILCYYGRNGEYKKLINELPCSKFEEF